MHIIMVFIEMFLLVQRTSISIYRLQSADGIHATLNGIIKNGYLNRAEYTSWITTQAPPDV